MIWIGASGFQYPEWKQGYPDKIPLTKCSRIAERFPTAEIKDSFRQLPGTLLLDPASDH